jgi:hypothetical protein
MAADDYSLMKKSRDSAIEDPEAVALSKLEKTSRNSKALAMT